MEERARRLGGRLEIASRPGAGTTVRLLVEAAVPAPARPARPVAAGDGDGTRG
jgi:hypothetical protein